MSLTTHTQGVTFGPRDMVRFPIPHAVIHHHTTHRIGLRNGEMENVNQRNKMGIGMEITIKLDIRPVLVYCVEVYIVAIAEHVRSY